MRTTIRINDNVLNDAKKLAVSSNTTLSALIETALKEMLFRRQKKGAKKKTKLITFKGRGLKHGVDLDDSASLVDLMEGK